MPWKCQESCIWTQCFTKNVLDIVSTRLCFIHELWERVGMNSPHTNSHPQSPHFRFEKQIETGQTWCFCTKKKIDWAEATAKAYKWRLWNTGFWLAESIWSQPMALALRFAANPLQKYTKIHSATCPSKRSFGTPRPARFVITFGSKHLNIYKVIRNPVSVTFCDHFWV